MPPTMAASTKAGGSCFITPDTCLTPAPPAPPVPTPYPNSGMPQQATKVSTKVKIVQKEVITQTSEIPRSMGDEAGVNGGVMSGVNMNKIVYKKGAAKVKIQGKPCCYLTSTTGHNGMNANMPSGLQVAPSQTKVLVSM